MKAPRRMRAAGSGVATGHLVLGAVAWLALGVPGAMLFFGLAPLLRPRPRRDDGGTPARAPEPPEPPWWPEFDRALREWAAQERSHA